MLAPAHPFCSSIFAAVLVASTVIAIPVNPHASLPEHDGREPLEMLRFNGEGKFRIIQVADLHFGEAADSWGPVQDALSIKWMKTVMRYESADLVVLSGDQLSAAGIDKNSTRYWDIIVDSLEGTPHTAILGNHDAEPPHADGSNQSLPGAHTNRTQLMVHDMLTRTSHSQLGPANLRPAVSVYVVDIWPSDPSAVVPELQLVHLDSGGGGMEEEVYSQQIAWFNQTMRTRRHQFGRAVPAFVFVHIPLWEFEGAMQHGARCVGEQDEEVTPTVNNTGLFAAIEAHPEVAAVFVGHDHCNDFCCKVGGRGVDLCFGRHSGSGGYQCDGFVNGARVIDIQAEPWKVSTHIRLVNGSVVHQAELCASGGSS